VTKTTYVAGLVVLSLAAGCNSGGPGRLVAVQGRVTVDGKPLATGSVVFKPDAAKGNLSKFEPSSTIGANGEYSLFTAEKPGAPLGWYKVGVVAQEADPKNPYSMKSLVPARLSDPETSGLSIEVKDNATAESYDLKLSHRGASCGDRRPLSFRCNAEHNIELRRQLAKF